MVSVAEHVIMTILVLVRNFVPAHEQIQAGEWDVAGAAKNEFDLEGKVVGTVAVGRIGERVLRRLKPFDCKELLYFDYQPLRPEVEAEIGCRRVDTLEEMLAQCDVVTINCPLHEKTRGLFNKDLIAKMKPGGFCPVPFLISLIFLCISPLLSSSSASSPLFISPLSSLLFISPLLSRLSPFLPSLLSPFSSASPRLISPSSYPPFISPLSSLLSIHPPLSPRPH